MFEAEVKLKKWGSSIGAILPSDKVKEENLKAGEKITLLVLKGENPLKESFGKIKKNRKTSEIMKEIDDELWNF